MSKDKELVIVYAGDQIEANIIKGLLENSEIKAFLQDEMVGSWAPWYAAPGGVGAVKVVVAQKDADQALAISKKNLEEKEPDLPSNESFKPQAQEEAHRLPVSRQGRRRGTGMKRKGTRSKQ